MHRQIAGRAKAVGTVEHVLCGALERRGINRFVPDDKPLPQVGQMRRHVPRRADACRDERRVRHRGDRPLPVGAGNVKCSKRPFGVVERGAEA